MDNVKEDGWNREGGCGKRQSKRGVLVQRRLCKGKAADALAGVSSRREKEMREPLGAKRVVERSWRRSGSREEELMDGGMG
jgi:hypothetical protein